jgi:hypothetical protein
LRNGLMVRGRRGSFEPVKTGQTSRFHMENMLRTKMPCSTSGQICSRYISPAERLVVPVLAGLPCFAEELPRNMS